MNAQKKKIAIFVDSRKESGGEYQHLLYTIKNIKKNNKENLKFAIICTSKKLNLNLENENLELHYFSMNAIERFICYQRNFGSLIRRLKKYFFPKNKFETFLKKLNIDLVYFTSPSQYSLYLEDTKFFITIPDVDHRVDLEFPEVVDRSEFHRKDEIYSKSLPRALAVITNAEILKKRISYFFGVSEKRIYIINLQPASSINNFQRVDTAKQKKIRENLRLPKSYLFYPAMYLPHKNHKTLIDALKILRLEFKIDLKMVFSGSDVGYLKNIKRYAFEQNLSNEITFLDFVEDDYLPYLYLDAFAVVFPVLIGPTFTPPWEGFKMEIPVIFSELSGIKDVYGDAVYYINPLEAESIANGIKKLFEENSLREQLIMNGKKKLKEVEDKDEYTQIFEIIKKYRKIKETWKFDS